MEGQEEDFRLLGTERTVMILEGDKEKTVASQGKMWYYLPCDYKCISGTHSRVRGR